MSGSISKSGALGRKGWRTYEKMALNKPMSLTNKTWEESMDFKIHTKETAPEASRTTLEAVEKTYGFVPNFYGVLAESPAALRAYARHQ